MDTNHDCCAGGVPPPIDWSFRRAVQDAHNRRINALLDNLRMTRDVRYRYLQRITAEEPMETETKPFNWAVAQQHPAYVFTKDGEPVTHLVAVGDHHLAGYIPSKDWPLTWSRSSGCILTWYSHDDLVLRVPKPAAPPHEVFVNIWGYGDGDSAGMSVFNTDGDARAYLPSSRRLYTAERYVRAADCELPSHHKIGDRVQFRYNQGEITAVTFRIGKVTYDIQLNCGGEELRNVDSAFVSA